MTETKPKPKTIFILLILLAFQALSGLFGGAALVLDPSGSSIRLPLSLLEGSPFGNFLIPGIILFLVLGIFPLIIFSLLRKKDNRAWFGSLVISSPSAFTAVDTTPIANIQDMANPTRFLLYAPLRVYPTTPES